MAAILDFVKFKHVPGKRKNDKNQFSQTTGTKLHKGPYYILPKMNRPETMNYYYMWNIQVIVSHFIYSLGLTRDSMTIKSCSPILTHAWILMVRDTDWTSFCAKQNVVHSVSSRVKIGLHSSQRFHNHRAWSQTQWINEVTSDFRLW